jgi:hypothetical protein
MPDEQIVEVRLSILQRDISSRDGNFSQCVFGIARELSYPWGAQPMNIMNSRLSKSLTVLLITAFLPAAASTAWAETQWEKNHPRRDQVNDRLQNQNKRINKELKEGEITKQQASKLHKEDRQIRQEERDMASQNGGHITKSEQKVLNQQLNGVSKQIGQ